MFHSRVLKATDITAFSRQVATLLAAGIPFVQALTIMGRDYHKPAMRVLIAALKKYVEAGGAVSEVLSKYPNYFNKLYRSLVAAGEKTGLLDVMFDRIASYREKNDMLRSKVKKALFYPLTVFMVAILVMIGMLLFVIPQFENLFAEFGASLPLPTRFLINMAHFLQRGGWSIIILFPLLFGVLKIVFRHSEKALHAYDRWLLKLPIIGAVLVKAALARFARTLATAYAAGIPLLEALHMVADATGNRLYSRAVNHVRGNVATGQSLQRSLNQAKLFPGMVIQMVAIGEESGTLEAMLNKAASIFEEEIAQTIASLSSLLEPIIMLVLGLVIGGLVVAMYLPIFKLGSVV